MKPERPSNQKRIPETKDTSARSGRLHQAFRDRSKAFAKEIVSLFVRLPRTREEISVIGKQLLRSGTSVAAHVREASRARSTSEFVSKLNGATQEADESALWLELLRESCGIDPTITMPLEQEASELI